MLYPSIIIAAIATVWAIGWANSLESKASVGFWRAGANPLHHAICAPESPPQVDSNNQIAILSDRD
jgi:hypothetical protein